MFKEIKTNLTHYIPNIKEIKPVYGPCRAGDIPHSLASIAKARKLLGYNPEFSLTSGLKHTIKWYYETTVSN